MGKITSTAMKIKAYSVPLILFMGAMFYQLYVIPHSYPTSHYDILGVRLHASIVEVEEAYKKLSPMWNSDMEVPSSLDFIKIQYAYELLTNPIWKRNYDIFRIEEQSHVVKEATQQYAKERFSSVPLPLLAGASVQGEQDLKTIDFKGFQDLLQDAQPLLILVYSNGSSCCSHLDGIWKRTVTLLDGVANTAAVELGEAQLAAYLAEKRPTGQPFFRNGLPSVVAFPPGCKTAKCLLRFDGQFSVDAVTDWVATTILGLPRIPYYSRETLAKNFIAKTSPHKVKVIFLSKTGERATPFVRLAAMNYQAHASFAFVLWREEESSFWWNSLEVESAPAIAFLKDPGVKPVVHHGPANNSWFLTLMEQNKYQELPQLRPATSLELGCDARGYSRAGVDTTSWYCVVLAGRLSNELNQMRGTMCRIQETLSNGSPVKSDDEDQSSIVPAATALKKRRLSFAWLNGETQKNYCLFYLQSETVYETCGPRKDISDVPRLFIVRYKRNASEEENLQVKKTPKSPWNEFLNQDVDPASQLVARYDGSNEIPEIIEWISNIIKDGDSRDLPFFRTRTPELVPEGDVSMFSGGVRGVLSKSSGLKQKLVRFVIGISDDLGDPRIGPILLLLSLLSFGSVWYRRSQPDQSKSSQPKEEADQKPISKEEARKRRKEQERTASYKARPTSITDEEPKNARQVEFSDSDSD